MSLLILLYIMSKKDNNVDINDDKKKLRSLELSPNVNDYDTGEPIEDCSIGNALSQKTNPKASVEIKKGDKFRA